VSGPVLLDVNVLVALFDPDHVHHEAAHRWFAAIRSAGWATCPLTENALVRVLSHPSYAPVRLHPAEIVDRLRRFCESGDHVFWSDAVTLRDARLFASAFPLTHRQVTDVYLLGLARQHGGRLATFDRTIPLASVVDATNEHLALIPL
jgi:toxin-antitoxin system PIN domain toxin